jgi:hypothetical protein
MFKEIYQLVVFKNNLIVLIHTLEMTTKDLVLVFVDFILNRLASSVVLTLLLHNLQ